MSAAACCPTCCESYTTTVRVPVVCAYCEYAACGACCRQYILGSMQDAHCMSCRHTWTREVLADAFTPAWMNGAYKAHREMVLVEREKQLLPATQIVLPNYRAAKRLRDQVAEKMCAAADLKRRYHAMTLDANRDKILLDRVSARGYRGVGSANVDRAAAAADAADDDDDAVIVAASSSRARPVEFIMPCMASDCRGFMGATMQCGVCNLRACTHCSVALPAAAAADDTAAAAHTCDPNDIASFKHVKTQTRGCPSCAVPTFRNGGCAQMWCVACNTAWDWNTREVVRGAVHNPHYFAYLAAGGTPTEAGGGGGGGPGGHCGNGGGVPDGWAITRATNLRLITAFPRADSKKPATWSPAYETLRDDCHRVLFLARPFIHVHAMVLPRLRAQEARALADNTDLRLKYLERECDEAAFKAHLQRREKARAKRTALSDVYSMARDVARDAIRSYIDRDAAPAATAAELQKVRDYANEHLAKICQQYKIKAEPI